MPAALKGLVAAELREPVEPRVREMAAAIAAIYPEAARGVLFYGSCLRTRDLDGQMLDFYLIVSDYRAAYGKSWMATANRLVPPNVYPFEHRGLAAKYAVLSEADFKRECGMQARSVSVWARFAQPSRLVWARDEVAASGIADSIALAAPTLFQRTLPLMDEMPPAPIDVWKKGFSLTYGAELRAERGGRPSSVVDADPERYERFGMAVLDEGRAPATDPVSRAQMEAHWRRTRRNGKLLSVLRLGKASATFAGGIDYLAWKINRHAGSDIRIAPWQRRWPLVAAFILLPQLLKRGAIR